MRIDRRWILAAIFAALLFRGSTAEGEPYAGQSAIIQAAFNDATPNGQAQETVRFGRRAVQVGDQTEQSIGLDVRMMLTMRRANELLGKHQSFVRTNQRRVVTTNAIKKGLVTDVTVSYPMATKTIVDGQTTGTTGRVAEAPTAESEPSPQSVQGKTYHCHREPGINGKLVVTDSSGNRPPTEEYEMVSQQMDMVGRPNPLASFLADRTIAVGEKLEVPKEVAAQIFNLGNKFGEVTQFTLTLQKVESTGDRKCGIFLANVEAMSSDASQMRLQVEGPLVVEVDTCRARSIVLLGPIGMSETRGSYSTTYQVIGTGRLQLKIESEYRETERQ
jgi:hypothetical protein